MLSEEAKEAVALARPERKVAFVFHVHAGVDRDALTRIKDVRKRASELASIYASAKQPLLDKVCKYESAGFRVVDDLLGTPQIIASAPVKTWRKILLEQADLLSGPTVDVLPNNPRWTFA